MIRPCMIRGHVAAPIHMDRDDLKNQTFEGKGALGKMHQLFGARMDTLPGVQRIQIRKLAA